jgi:hypothetical protein
MNVRMLYTMVALLLASSMAAGAQVVRQPIGTPRLSPAPAPVMSSVNQTPQTIFPQIWFQVPQGVVSILVSRTPAGGTGTAVTPKPVPLSQVPTPTGQYYYWTDNTLNALGTYSYQVAGIQADGRTGTSTPIAYTPVVTEPMSLTVTKPNPFTATITFQQSKMAAQAYRLYGSGLPASGVFATVNASDPRAAGTVSVGDLAAGTYNWVLKAQYSPGVLTAGVPVTVTVP